MIRKRAQLFSLHPVQRARVIAALLLASLAWGATAELNHHHGLRTSPATQINQSSAALEISESNAPQFQANDNQGTSSKSKATTDCTICQLHQNLSATLFSHAPRLGPEEVTLTRAATAVVFELTDFTPNQRGRAPPSIL